MSSDKPLSSAELTERVRKLAEMNEDDLKQLQEQLAAAGLSGGAPSSKSSDDASAAAAAARKQQLAAPAPALKRSIDLRFANPLKLACVVFLVWLVLSMFAATKINFIAVRAAPYLYEWSAEATRLVAFCHGGLATVIPSDRLRQLLLLWAAPALVFAHIGEAAIAYRRIRATQRAVGSGAHMCSLPKLLAWCLVVLVFGFPQLRILAEELSEVRTTAAVLRRREAAAKRSGGVDETVERAMVKAAMQAIKKGATNAAAAAAAAAAPARESEKVDEPKKKR